MDGFFKGIIVVGLLVFNILLAGFVATKLWLWFLVPMFKLPEIGWVQGVALLLTIRYFNGGLSKSKSDNGVMIELIGNFIYTLLVLLIAWLLKHYI